MPEQILNFAKSINWFYWRRSVFHCACFFLLLLVGAKGFSIHINKPDSLLDLLKFDKSDSIKLKLYRGIGGIYKKQFPDTAIEYFGRGLLLEKKSNLIKNVGLFYTDLGEGYMESGFFDKSENYFDSAMTIFTQLGDENNKAIIYGFRGNLYWRRGLYKRERKFC